MADCKWCDKSLPGDAVPACGSCLFRSSLEKSDKEDSSKDNNFDLSSLSDKPKASTKPRSVWALQADLQKVTYQQALQLQEVEMVEKKVKSNSLRNRSVVFYSNLILHFNEDGVAKFPESELSRVQKLIKARPGRFWLIEDNKADEKTFEEVLAETQAEVAKATEELKSEEDEDKVEEKEEEKDAESEPSEDVVAVEKEKTVVEDKVKPKVVQKKSTKRKYTKKTTNTEK